ncbi:Subtilisin-like protease, fibronectin type-III domain [Dillenia turbinata]|uniref:Subtilisin-like protease, fibronectin type-III domain n=1 Tax=Dillenia turbinata TaxID=194707 RepID=A0AAN8VXM2_9MAGN
MLLFALLSIISEKVQGTAINTFDLNGTSYPLIWGGDAVNFSAGANTELASYCWQGYLSSTQVKGKIVLCDGVDDGSGILVANGVGAIWSDSFLYDVSYSWDIPTTIVSSEDGERILDYIRTSENPIATILVGETLKDVMAPSVVSFSSRGPSIITPDILKVTTTRMDPTKHVDLEFAYGAGHINPAKAVKPGLVFDASVADYVNFLCKQGYNTTRVRLITGDNRSCNGTKIGRAWDLNYPSFSLAIEDGKRIMGVFPRTVTNVGSANSTYTATITSPALCTVKVEPSTLTFSTLGEKQSFTVTIAGKKDVAVSNLPITSGAIVWSDGTYTVRTPIVLYTILPGSNNGSYSMPAKEANFFGSPQNQKNGHGFLRRN